MQLSIINFVKMAVLGYTARCTSTFICIASWYLSYFTIMGIRKNFHVTLLQHLCVKLPCIPIKINNLNEIQDKANADNTTKPSLVDTSFKQTTLIIETVT